MSIKRAFTVKGLLKFFFYVVAACYAVPYFLKISLGLYRNFEASTISFDLDSIYLNWNTSFPAVTVCEVYNGEKLLDISEQFFGPDRNHKIDDFVGEIVFFRGTCSTCSMCEHIVCPANFTDLLELFRNKCGEIINNCSYADEFFNCCDEFLPIRTEYGICYAFNSSQKGKQPHNTYKNNRIQGAGRLKFEAVTDIQLHIHPPIEIPFSYSEGIIRETILMGTVKQIVINIWDLYNHPNVYAMPLEDRNCRFGHELTATGRSLGLYEMYSHSTCIVECLMGIHVELCNCTSHILTTAELEDIMPMCDYKGLICLMDHSEEINRQRRLCDCMSSCEEPEYNIIYNSQDDIDELEPDASTIIEISLMGLPNMRYVRRVIKNPLDLIISIGGLAGLFFNVSLVRLVEFAFYLWQFKWKSLVNRFT